MRRRNWPRNCSRSSRASWAKSASASCKCAPSVRDQRALREWDFAEYYADHKYYAAARIYYNKIIKDYPETQLAQESHSRIDKFKDEPANPANPFQWLVDVLPASKREGPVLPKNLANIASSPNTTTTTK